MEGEKKRKRSDDRHQARQVNGGGQMTRGEEDEAVVTAAAQPSEEEVEEFFSILRSMNVALKYFEKSGTGGDGRKMTTSMLEGGRVEVDGVRTIGEVAGGGGSKAGLVIVDNGGPGLDLNVLPEAET